MLKALFYFFFFPVALFFNVWMTIFYLYIETGMHSETEENATGLISRHSVWLADQIEYIGIRGCEIFTHPYSWMADGPLWGK